MMQPTFLLEQIERMQSQSRVELDPATKREMERTVRHLYKEYRKATRHRQPWFGLKLNLGILLVIFASGAALCVFGEVRYGWGNTLSAILEMAGVLMLVLSTVFFAMKRLSPEQYSSMVNNSLSFLRNVGDGGGALDSLNTEADKKLGNGPRHSSLSQSTTSHEEQADD